MATNNDQIIIKFHDLINASLYNSGTSHNLNYQFCTLNYQYHNSSPMSIDVLCEDGKRFISLLKDYKHGSSNDNYYEHGSNDNYFKFVKMV